MAQSGDKKRSAYIMRIHDVDVYYRDTAYLKIMRLAIAIFGNGITNWEAIQKIINLTKRQYTKRR